MSSSNANFNNATRTSNVGKNAAASLANKLVILVLKFISRRIFIQLIGVEYLGINGLFANVLTLLSLADMGIGTAINVSLYKPIAEKDELKLSALLNYYRKLYYLIAAVVLSLGCALIPVLKYIVNMDRNIPGLYVYYVMFVLNSAVSYLFAYKASIIRADQRNYLVNRIEVFVQIGKMVLQVLAMLLTKQYFVYLLLEIFGTMAHNIVVAVVADKNYPFIRKKAQLPKEERKDVFTNVSSMLVYKISWSSITGTDNILISVICGTIIVGLYSNYSTITTELTMIITLLFEVVTPSIGNLVVTSSPEKRYSTFNTIQLVSFWLGAMVVVGLFVLTEDFISLWVGSDMILGKKLLLAVVCDVYYSVSMRPVWSYREGTGMYKQIRYIMLVTAILNIFLSIVLGKWLGVSGIIFATSISKLLTSFWYEPSILFKNFFKISPMRFYLKYVMNVVLVIVCMVGSYLAVKWLPNGSILWWLVKAVICMVITNGVMLVRYYNTAEFKSLVGHAKALLRTKGK